MRTFSVKQLAGLAGVSIRTLHHYDRIGLLKPSHRSEKGYRYYGRMELFTLQQILFFKELDFPLKEICEIVNNPSFDLLEAMEFHREQLVRRADRLQKLLVTVDKTIDELKNSKEQEMTEKEIYAGFSEAQIKDIRREVSERWGKKPLLDSEKRVQAMGKQGIEDARKQDEKINRLLASLMDMDPADAQVQQAIALHHQHVNLFHPFTNEAYRGLGKMYVDDERFRVHYEAYRPGLADFIRRGIMVFCDNDLQIK